MPAKIKDLNLITNIVDDFKNGLSKKSICKKYKISEPAVHRIIKENYKQVFSRISESTMNKVVELTKTLDTKSKIATAAGIDISTVTKILKYYKITVERKPKEITKKITEYDRLINSTTPEYVMDQLTTRSVFNLSLEFNVAHSTLLRYMKYNNIEYKKFVLFSKDILPEIKELVIFDFSNQITKKEICKKYNISSKHIDSILKEYNLPTYQNKLNKSINTNYITYVKLARRLTKVVKNTYKLETPDGFHWDHKLSIVEGYQQGIPAYLIASKENLELVPIKVNLSKGTSSNITKDELYQLIGL